jgi:hypothetical protein
VTPALITLAATATISFAVQIWLREWKVAAATAIVATLMGVLIPLGWVFNPSAAYWFAGIEVAWFIWRTLLAIQGARDEGGETVAQRLAALAWRAPALWVVGVFYAFVAILAGMVIVYLVIGIPVGFIDVQGGHNCRPGFLDLGGCHQPSIGPRPESFLHGHVGLGIAVFAAVIGVAALLAAFGSPDVLSRREWQPAENRLEAIGNAGILLGIVTVVAAVGLVLASWFQVGQFTGPPP